MSIPGLFKSLKRLATSASFNKTSEPDTTDPSPNAVLPYNCIAHALEDDTKHWWPMIAYWPRGVPNEETIDAFIKLFQKYGYTLCQNGTSETGVKKVAIYANSKSKPTHVARQMQSGLWTSKAGPSYDFTHDLSDLEGSKYGKVVKYLSKPI